MMALLSAVGLVKVTTFEEPSRDTFLEAGKPVCDLRIYPAGAPPHPQAKLHVDKLGLQSCFLALCTKTAVIAFMCLFTDCCKQAVFA